MAFTLLAIDNTPLCHLALQDVFARQHYDQSYSQSQSLKSQSVILSSLAEMPMELGPNEALLINSSVPDFRQLPRCPLPRQQSHQVAILVSRLTPLGPKELAARGYYHTIVKDRGFAPLCQDIAAWHQRLSMSSSSQSVGAPARFQSSTPRLDPQIMAQLREELRIMIDSGLIRVESDIHAKLERVISAWLSETLEPKLSQEVAAQLPGLVTTALSAELDRLTTTP